MEEQSFLTKSFRVSVSFKICEETRPKTNVKLGKLGDFVEKER